MVDDAEAFSMFGSFYLDFGTHMHSDGVFWVFIYQNLGARCGSNRVK